MSAYGLSIPDWRDKDAYPKCFEDIYERDWRWQFLRRYPEYQQAWNRGIPDEGITYHAEIAEIDRKPAPEDSEQCRTVFRLKHLVNPWGEQRIPNATGSMWDSHTGAMTINPPDPNVTRGRDFVMVGFDLNTTLKPQIDNVYKKLKHQQKVLKEEVLVFKKQKDKWPRYLRVIDAIDQGATPTEIYNQFAEESASGDEDKLDDFYRPGKQPDATAMGWHSRAMKVMEMAIRLL